MAKIYRVSSDAVRQTAKNEVDTLCKMVGEGKGDFNTATAQFSGFLTALRHLGVVDVSEEIEFCTEFLRRISEECEQ